MSQPITEATAVLLTLCVMGGYYAVVRKFGDGRTGVDEALTSICRGFHGNQSQGA